MIDIFSYFISNFASYRGGILSEKGVLKIEGNSSSYKNLKRRN